MNEEQNNKSETPEVPQQQGASEEPHEWNIEEFNTDIIEKRPPNDRIITFGIPEEESEEGTAAKDNSEPSEAPEAPEAPEENP